MAEALESDANQPAANAPAQTEPVALIAGGGQTPLYLADRLEARGVPFFVAMIEGDADPALRAYDHMMINVAALGRLEAALKARRIRTIVMLGSVKGRPDINQFRPNLTTLRILYRLVPALRRGDDALLRAVITMMQNQGFTVKGAHELEPTLLVPQGQLGQHQIPAKAREALGCALEGATRLGALDAGQAVVAIGRRLVALEGAEGTDAMLARVAHLRSIGRLSQKPGGVLVKLRKPGQDMRVDLPTIGPETVKCAIEAKLLGIAAHAENSLIVDRPATIAAADAAGLFVVGIDPSQSDWER